MTTRQDPPKPAIVIDEDAIAYEIDGAEPVTRRRIVTSAAQAFVAGTGALYLSLAAMQWQLGTLHRAFDLTGFGLIRNVMVPVAAGVLTAASTVVFQLLERRRLSRPTSELAKESAGSWRALTEPGWGMRMVRYGAGLGLIIGIPIGVLYSTLAPGPDLVGGNRGLTFLTMCGIWAAAFVPVAFAMRSALLWGGRRTGVIR